MAVETVVVPPLRERISDISLLADLFAHEITDRIGLKCSGFDASARAQLESYSWPGNVRELQNAVESSAARCRARLNGASSRSAQIEERDLPTYVKPDGKKNAGDASTREEAAPTSLNRCCSSGPEGLRAIIRRLLQERSPQTIGDLSRETGRTRKAVKRQVKNLESEGVVVVLPRRGRCGDEVSLPQ